MQPYGFKQVGRLGEQLASQFLQEQGYQILQRNFYTKRGEIDIIARQQRQIIFVEVKTRTNETFGTPAEAVNTAKKKHIYQTAKYYAYQTKQEGKEMRFDVVEVWIQEGKVAFHHIKQII